MKHSSVALQISSEAVPSIPPWFAEVVIVAQVFMASGVLKAVEERVRFSRARIGTYEVLDFLAVLIGYAVSAEPTLEAFYERLTPFAMPFMALFDRERLPHRSTLSRFLAALDEPTVEALRVLFLEDLVQRTAQSFPPGGIWDRVGHGWLVMDVDGTKQAARQRALPSLPELPAPHRRFDRVCAPAYLGGKRGEVARTRTTVLQAHTHQWAGTFSGAGNGDYRSELTRACQAIIRYAGWLCMPLSQILVRLDGLYGNLAVLWDLLSCGLGVIVRCKDYALLDLPVVAARLRQPADQHTTHPESGANRALFDCPNLDLLPAGAGVRLIVATHPTTATTKPPVGVLREGMVYELFLTTVPQAAFTCADVLDLYLHRGSFETVLSDEDLEQDTDRWCSRTACGQEFWQILSQWLWNLRLDLGLHLSPSSMRLTEFAAAEEPVTISPAQAVSEPLSVPPSEVVSEPAVVPPAQTIRYGPPQWARRSFTKGFAGSDFVPQPDGTVLCPAGHPLRVHERRPERNGSLRVVYGARITHCRPCPLRALCLETTTTKKPRQVSAVLWPLVPAPSIPQQPPDGFAQAASVGSRQSPGELLAPHPVLWGDWPRCRLRRNFVHLLRTQTVHLTFSPLQPQDPPSVHHGDIQTRAHRARWRLSWQQRMARNARSSLAPPLKITIYGLPAAFAHYVGIALISA